MNLNLKCFSGDHDLRNWHLQRQLADPHWHTLLWEQTHQLHCLTDTRRYCRRHENAIQPQENDGAVRWSHVLTLLDDAEDWQTYAVVLRTNPELSTVRIKMERFIYIRALQGGRNQSRLVLFETDTTDTIDELEGTHTPHGQLFQTTFQSLRMGPWAGGSKCKNHKASLFLLLSPESSGIVIATAYVRLVRTRR